METSDRVIAVLQKTLMLDRGRFTDGALLVDDLGVTSLDRFELLMDLEEEFKISMDENEMGSIKTVGDLIAYIAARPLADPSPA
jgi:acyl carrier protein